ncbi:hypothetical protein HDV00_002379 [Rhizophlyctis rosea]|nr:hypothetical protein HDV00_002379 [Rhizophlyctis rosea]
MRFFRPLLQAAPTNSKKLLQSVIAGPQTPPKFKEACTPSCPPAKPPSLIPPQTTGLVGLEVHHNALPHLSQLYTRILHSVSRIPSTSAYRQSVESLTQQRLNIVQAAANAEEAEKQINAGVIEEVIDQAEDELKLILQMNKYKIDDMTEPMSCDRDSLESRRTFHHAIFPTTIKNTTPIDKTLYSQSGINPSYLQKAKPPHHTHKSPHSPSLQK